MKKNDNSKMKCKIIGSGGAIPTPRLFCECEICKKARIVGHPYKRNCSSFYIESINTLIDCPEDINDSLNAKNATRVDNLFITHWHPDHTFGLRLLLEANYDFIKEKVKKKIKIYIPTNVYNTLKEKYPTIRYMAEVIKLCNIIHIEDGNVIQIKNIKIKVVGYSGKNSETYAYLIEKDNKRLLYSPCDTISFKNYYNFKNIDVWVTECGMFSNYEKEISFKELINRIKKIKPKKIILTHIEEEELRILGWKHMKFLKDKYNDINFEFAEDGLEIDM